MSKKEMRTFDDVQVDHYKKHPKELEGYLRVALDEYQKDGDEAAFLVALSVAARAQGGFTKLAGETGLNRENLYRSLSKNADPRLSTVMQVLGVLGFSLTIGRVKTAPRKKKQCALR